MTYARLNIFHFADDAPKDWAGEPWKESAGHDLRSDLPMVLVVDDHKLIADTLCEILRSSGFQAVAAYDGWSALDLASRFHPDYLLSDVLMPKMNGVELAISIRKMYPKTRVFLFSGQAGVSEILRDAQKQGYEFPLIPKPIHPTKLIERLTGKSE